MPDASTASFKELMKVILAASNCLSLYSILVLFWFALNNSLTYAFTVSGKSEPSYFLSAIVIEGESSFEDSGNPVFSTSVLSPDA